MQLQSVAVIKSVRMKNLFIVQFIFISQCKGSKKVLRYADNYVFLIVFVENKKNVCKFVEE
jgi:hypothetical protein